MNRKLLFLVMCLTASEARTVAAELRVPWVELAADGGRRFPRRRRAGYRFFCPSVSADGVSSAVDAAVRPTPISRSRLRERTPAATTRLTVGGVPVPTLPAMARRIVVIGDTGCRIEGKAVQVAATRPLGRLPRSPRALPPSGPNW
jgi:hypothetical protein